MPQCRLAANAGTRVQNAGAPGVADARAVDAGAPGRNAGARAGNAGAPGTLPVPECDTGARVG